MCVSPGHERHTQAEEHFFGACRRDRCSRHDRRHCLNRQIRVRPGGQFCEAGKVMHRPHRARTLPKLTGESLANSRRLFYAREEVADVVVPPLGGMRPEQPPKGGTTNGSLRRLGAAGGTLAVEQSRSRSGSAPQSSNSSVLRRINRPLLSTSLELWLTTPPGTSDNTTARVVTVPFSVAVDRLDVAPAAGFAAEADGHVQGDHLDARLAQHALAVRDWW